MRVKSYYVVTDCIFSLNFTSSEYNSFFISLLLAVPNAMLVNLMWNEFIYKENPFLSFFHEISINFDIVKKTIKIL